MESEHPGEQRPSGSVCHAGEGLLVGSRPAWLELAVLIPLACAWFFWGTGVGDFVATEALRSVVVKEMLERGHGLLPTVHGRVYLRKPPLYAWTTLGLARAVGRFDEQVARWPSAAMAVLYVVILYFAGRWLVDVRAGPAAAVLGAGNWIVLDYGARAELDTGVLALTTLAVLLLGWAWMNHGWRRALGLTGCYAAALAGSFWKAPHVLLTVLLTLGGLAWLDRRSGRRDWWRFALHPWQVVPAVVCIGALGAWFLALSKAVGTGRTGRFVLLEFLGRVVPHSWSHGVEFLVSVPYLTLVTLPASVLAAGWLLRQARTGLDRRHRTSVSLLLAWLLPNLAFLLLVPAKAPRYWFPIFAPIVLLAVLMWRRYRAQLLAPSATRFCERACRVFLATGVACGLVLAVAGVVMWNRQLLPAGIDRAIFTPTAVACGLAMMLAGAWALSGDPLQRRVGLGLAFLVMLAAIKPVHVVGYLPARSAATSLRPSARQIDSLVPAGTPAFVLSDKPGNDRSGELADFGYYCRTRLYWPMDIDEALQRASGRWCYLLAQPEGKARIENRFGEGVEQIGQVDGGSKLVFVLRADRASTGHAVR